MRALWQLGNFPLVLGGLVLTVLAAAPALAQPLPVPQSRTGSCPWGFIWSGGHCLPSGRDAPLAVERKGGSCPSGWLPSAGHCIKDRERPSRR